MAKTTVDSSVMNVPSPPISANAPVIVPPAETPHTESVAPVQSVSAPIFEPSKDLLNYGQTDLTGRHDNPSATMGPTMTELPMGNVDNTHDVGLQALYDTIRSKALDDKLQGILVANLFQDGGVALGADGQFHLYADAVVQAGDRGIQFLNATMLNGQPDTLNYQRTTLTFNQALPSDYTLATRTAFLSDGRTAPAYWATDVENIRSNTVDSLTVLASNGNPVFQPTLNRYQTIFQNETAMLSNSTADTTLYVRNGSNTTYLGDVAPTVEIINNGGANTTVRNTYANGLVVERNVAYVDDQGQTASPDTLLAAGSGARDYLSGLFVQDTLSSNMFAKGPITTFGTAQSRLLAGLDAIVNKQDAADVLGGGSVPGAPDGLIH